MRVRERKGDMQRDREGDISTFVFLNDLRGYPEKNGLDREKSVSRVTAK